MRAHMAWPRESRDTKLYYGWGRPCGSRYSVRLGQWVVLRDRRDTEQERHDTALEARDTVPCATIQCVIQRTSTRTSALRHRATIRPGQAMTRPGQAYDTAQCAHRLGQGWLHCALNSVLTQCTVHKDDDISHIGIFLTHFSSNFYIHFG